MLIVAFRLLAALVLAKATFQDKPVLPPEPDAEIQKDTLKKVRDLFKEEYAKRQPAEQSALAQKLLQNGLDTNDDLPSKFTFLKEARELATAAGEADTALRAANELARSFAVDGPAMKLLVITKMAATTKDPEAARSLAKTCLALITDALRSDAYDTALSTVAKADVLAKVAQDANLLARLQELRKDVLSLKEEHLRVKPLIDNPGPGDAEAIGRFLCFVREDWDAGLPHLIAGAKPPLKAVVEKEALNPIEPEKQVELAEAWGEIAQKEKSPWRRSKIQSHARTWLEKAQPGATGVLKLKIDKKLAETEETAPGSINLLRLIDPRQDSIQGEWSVDSGILISPSAEWARIQIPYIPPDEYDLILGVERKEGGDAVATGLRQGKTSFGLVIDGWPSAQGSKTGLDQLDGTLTEKNPTSVTGRFLLNNRPSTIVIAVRKTGVNLTIDGKTVLNWQGSFGRLSPSSAWVPRDPKAPLLVGAYASKVYFSKILLIPVSGQGKKLR